MLAPGATFAGYRIESFLAQGGMGVVYRATQIALDRPVALKLVAPEFARDAEFRARFERESKLAAAIEHPNVIPVYEAGEADGELFISMRFVEGTDLSAEIARTGGLPPERAARIVSQVAAALDAAHARGLVHRDVKPANILIGEGERAYLTDFGLVKDLGDGADMTTTGTWVGTANYAAPEQFKGETVDARTDIYALGCVLFHSVTGSVPFPRSQAVASMWAHANEDPPPLSGAPAVFQPVVARAMAKDPAARFPSAGDLGRAATAAVEGRAVSEGERTVARGEAAPTHPAQDEPTAVRTQPNTKTPGATSRGRIAAIAAGAVVALVIVVVAVVALTGGGDDGGGDPNPRGGGGGTDTAGPAKLSATPIGGDIRAVAAGGGAAVTLDQKGRLVRVDGKDGKVTGEKQLLPLGGDVTFGFGSFWASTREKKRGPGVLQRINPDTGQPDGKGVMVAKRPLGIAPGKDVLWVSNASSAKILRVDPRGPTVVGDPVQVVDGPLGIAASDKNVWVTQFGNGTASNRAGGAVRIGVPFAPLDAKAKPFAFPKIEVGDNPLAVAYGGRFVWVVTSFGKLTRIDERSGDTLSTMIPGFGGLSSVVGTKQGVWVSGVSDGAKRLIVARLDLNTARPIGKPVDVGADTDGRLTDLAVSGNTLWVSAGDTLYRLKP